MTNQTDIENIRELDADIRSAMEPQVSMADLVETWITPLQGAERAKMARYIAERIHDVLVAWGDQQ